MTVLPAFNAVTASAQVIYPDRRLAPKYDSVQEQLWDLFDRLGEFESGVSWKANAMSRVRLLAAETQPEGGEPVPLNEGPAAEAMQRFAGGIGGQAQLMRQATIHLSVPGEGWFVGEPDPDQGEPSYDPESGFQSEDKWCVKSADEIRIARLPDQSGAPGFEVREGDTSTAWRRLPPDSLVVRFWEPHPRWSWRADSAARHARSDLVELDAVNKRILAQLMSRLASNGILLYDKTRLSIPAPSQPDSAQKVDPFAAVLVDVASRSMKDTTSPESLLPIPIGYQLDDLKDVDVKSLIQKIVLADAVDDKLLLLRESAIKNVASSLDIPAEVLLGMGDLNHWGCVDTATEVLTAHGWRCHDQVHEGDLILTMNHDTGLASWQPVQRMNRYQVDTDLVSMESVAHSSLTTGNHRWPTLYGDGRRWRTSETLREMDRLILAAPSEDQPVEAKWSDALVELVGWLWTEGNVQAGQVSIAQSHTRNPAKVTSIRRALTTLYGPGCATMRGMHQPAWRESVQRNNSSFGGPVTVFYLNKAASAMLLDVAPDKKVKLSFIRELTTAQLELFIDNSMAGDGWHNLPGNRDIWQRNPVHLDALELAAILTGRSVTRHPYNGGQTLRISHKAAVRPIKAARQANRRGYSGARIERVPYRGIVWCPTVQNSTWLARRNGTTYWTGNSWQIEESGIKIHIAPMAETITHSLTTGYLVPTLKAAGASLRGPSGGRLIVWYDPAELTQRPDQSAIATAGADRLWISEQSWRREAGFDDSDAPTPGELELMTQKITARTGLGGTPTAVGPDGEPVGNTIPDTMDDDRPDTDIGLPVLNGVVS